MEVFRDNQRKTTILKRLSYVYETVFLFRQSLEIRNSSPNLEILPMAINFLQICIHICQRIVMVFHNIRIMPRKRENFY